MERTTDKQLIALATGGDKETKHDADRPAVVVSGTGRPRTTTPRSPRRSRAQSLGSGIFRQQRTTAESLSTDDVSDQHPDGRYSVRGAMKRFGVQTDKVRRWIKRGMVQAVQEDFDWCVGVWWLSIDAETARRLEEDATKRKRTKK